MRSKLCAEIASGQLRQFKVVREQQLSKWSDDAKDRRSGEPKMRVKETTTN